VTGIYYIHKLVP